MTARASHSSVLTGVLLAGGQSRRLGGGDKGLLALAGKPMIAHVRDRLAPQVGQMVLSANGDPSRFAALGLPIVADTVAGFAGPLAGLLAGMRWSEANAPEARAIVSVSADAPFLPEDLVARLSTTAAGRPARIVLGRSDSGVHPVIGLWPLALAADLETALESGVRKVLDWARRHDTVEATFPPIELDGRTVDPFFNVNTPEELAEARALIEGRRHP
jgi:molybdopterin-guanine dinucleotide biosynthesis protein A